MTCLQLLVFLCWCSSIFAVTSCFRVDGYSCVSTYWKSITCVLNITSNPAGPPDTNFSLKFFNNKARTETTCPLVLMNNTYTCVCKVTEFNLHHTDVLSIQLCNDSSCLYLMRSFKPSMNIQLMPPHDVEVNDTSEHVNITWKSGYEQHRYLSNRLDYELLLQKPHSSWSQTLKPRQTFESIPKSRFDRFDMDATYCIKVRSKPLGSGYNGTWSEWSPVTCWKNDAQIVDGYSCVSTYWKSITCVLNITSNPAGPPDTNFSLKFFNNKARTETTCPLVLMNNTYTCVCKVTEFNLHHTDVLSIQLCNDSSCLYLMRSFKPTMNIQLTPPHDVEVNDTSEHVNITWKSGYEQHRYLSNRLDYELLLQKPHSSWSQTLKPRQTFESIPKSSFDTDATYCIKVRSKPLGSGYNGTWSEWSPVTCWKNDVQIEPLSLLVILTRSLGPVCVIVGVALFMFYSPAARMKMKTLSHTPSPAPFFQPLFQQHEGNLQDWLSPQGKFTLTYKTEEILVTSAVSVVPKPITKDPAENQDFLNLSAPPLVFSQCPSSYVGLPVTHEATQPVTMVCPKDMSYTQLPCSIWGFGNGEVQVVSCPPQTVLEISRTDSGCSCEDLTQSSGCSLPSSPVTVSSPPPCFCNDYCILNKTAEGVIPVLVSGLKMCPDVTSDSQQEDKS